MAAELVESSSKPHALIHDLESFFWVLLWIVLTQVKSDLTDEGRTSYLDHMKPTFYSYRSNEGTMGSKDGVQSGGSSKRVFLSSKALTDGGVFKIARNTTLRDLLIAVRRLVAIPFKEPAKYESPYAHDAGSAPDSEYDERIKAHNQEMVHLKSHKKMLSQFAQALADEWPDNDKADPQVTLRPQSYDWYSQSDFKRSRSIVEEGGPLSKPPLSKRKA
jgi:protein kinase-like protein